MHGTHETLNIGRKLYSTDYLTEFLTSVTEILSDKHFQR